MARQIQSAPANHAQFFQNSATPDKTGNGHFHAVFPTTGSPFITIDGDMPADYAGGDIDVVIKWCSFAANSGTMVWSLSWEKLDEGGHDVETDSFDTPKSGSEAPDASLGVPQYTRITFTNAEADNISAGDAYRLKIQRDTATDTMPGIAIYLRAVVEEV